MRHAWDTASCRERHDLSSASARRRHRRRWDGRLRSRVTPHGEPGRVGSPDRGRATVAKAPRADPGRLLEALSHGRRLGRLDDAAAGAGRARSRIPARAHARRLRRDERHDGAPRKPGRLRRLGRSGVHGLVVGRRRARIRAQRGRGVPARRSSRAARPRRGVRPRGAVGRNTARRRSQRRGQRGGRPRPRVAAPRTPFQRARRLLRPRAPPPELHRRHGCARHPRARRGRTRRRRRVPPGRRRARRRGALLARGRLVRRGDRDAAPAAALGDRPARSRSPRRASRSCSSIRPSART